MSPAESKKNLTLITGGARSGKSELAESLVEAAALPVHYIATMAVWPDDAESMDRIERHRRRRPQHWNTLEVPALLGKSILKLPAGPAMVVIDCISVYVSNMLLENFDGVDDLCAREKTILNNVEDILSSIDARGDLIFVTVTNEVGWGIVPDNALSRAYRDILGSVNQLFARHSSTVWLTCSGLRLRLKP